MPVLDVATLNCNKRLSSSSVVEVNRKVLSFLLGRVPTAYQRSTLACRTKRWVEITLVLHALVAMLEMTCGFGHDQLSVSSIARRNFVEESACQFAAQASDCFAVKGDLYQPAFRFLKRKPFFT